MTASSPLRRGAVSALDVLGRLTERDRLICRVLWEHRILTTEQICDLCFTRTFHQPVVGAAKVGS